MSETRQYKNPPLVEVFCELFFALSEGEEWDAFQTPQFYERIRHKMPVRKDLHTVGIAVTVPHGAKGGQGLDVRPHGPPTPRYRFQSSDGKTVAQIAENLLVVNQLPPYYGWESFQSVLLEAFSHYVDLWPVAQIERVALHYVDKVVVPESQFELAAYFNLYPVLPIEAGEPITNVAMAFEVAGAGEGDILALSFRQQPSADPDRTAFLFQFDYVATQARPATSAHLSEWLAGAHEHTRRLFENTFTERCKQLFRAEQ